MYYLIYAGYGPSVCYGASYAETLEEVTEGLYSLCESSVEHSDDIDEEYLDVSDFNALTDDNLSRNFVENFHLQFGDSEIRTLLLVDDEDQDIKEHVTDFILNGPIDLSDYFAKDDNDEDEQPEIINITEAVNDLPKLFDELQDVFEEMSWTD